MRINLAPSSLKWEVSAHLQTAIFQYQSQSTDQVSHGWRKLVLFIFSTSWHSMKLNLHWVYLLTNQVDQQLHQLDHVTSPESDCWSVNYTLEIRLKWCYLSSPFVKDYHWSKFHLHTLCENWDSRGGGSYTSPSTNNVWKRAQRTNVDHKLICNIWL